MLKSNQDKFLFFEKAWDFKNNVSQSLMELLDLENFLYSFEITLYPSKDSSIERTLSPDFDRTIWDFYYKIAPFY